VIRKIITEYTFEPGVRDIGRLVEEIARKLNRAILEGRIDLNAISDGTLVVPPQDVEKYLGDVKVEPRRAYETVYGESFGLSVMEHEGAVLGDILPIHARLVPGRHAKEASFTGRLGESMKESAKIALSCARNFLEEHGMKAELELLNDSLIHISTANGAQPKDGPSAGLALFSAILSAVTKRPLLPMMAMTGELELTERVTKVGGIKGKVLAAERARLKGVVLPKENEKDFNQLPQVVRDKIKVYPVANIHEALPILFGDDFPPKTV
jgi:ATP-dependent Lon protease